jgi:hypothetical protein
MRHSGEDLILAISGNQVWDLATRSVFPMRLHKMVHSQRIASEKSQGPKVVTDSAVLGSEPLLAASKALTVKPYVVFAVRFEIAAEVVPKVVATGMPLAKTW